MAKLTLNVPMRWSDLDAYGHVNNARMLTILEEARIKTFWAGNYGDDFDAPELAEAAKVLGGGEGVHMLVAGQRIEYVRPLEWTGADLKIRIWLGTIGGASLEVCYEVIDHIGELAAKATTSMVLVNSESGTPQRIPTEQRERLAALVDEPLQFRR